MNFYNYRKILVSNSIFYNPIQITNNYKIYGLINGIIFAQLIIVTISLLGALYYLKKQL